MSNPAVYADLVKIPSDFLKKDYPETQQIEITENLSQYPISLVNTLTRKQDGSVLFNFNPMINLGKQFQNGLLSINADTAKNVKGELTFNSLAPGLKAVVTVDSNSGQTELQYKKDAVALTAIVRSNKKITTSAVFGHNQFSIGVLANINVQSQQLEGLEGTLVYRHGGFLLGLSPKNNGQNLAVTLFDRVSPRLALGADVNLNMKALDAAPQFTVGSQYYLDSKSFLKVKVNQDLRVGLGYTVPVNDTTKVQLGLNVNAKDLSLEGKHHFGFNVTLAL